jgi:hypothetical protein
MSIEKKSLISTLKATKKANVVNSTPSPEPIHKTNKHVKTVKTMKLTKS